MPTAVIALEFDPILRLGDIAVRWQAVALLLGLTVALVFAAAVARRAGLRADDLLFIAVGVVPGAVIGGRLGYVVGHLDFYVAHPAAIIDTGQGSLTLGLAVVGGASSGAVVARLLGAPIGRWLHVATGPLLFALLVGKLAMVLAGSGQGQPTDVAWATAYSGAGPWGSLAPEIPSHPAQVYEALAVLGTAAAVAILGRAGAFRAGDGRSFLAAVAIWSVTRVAIGSTWRDAPVAGPFGVEQLIGLAVAAGAAIAIVLLARRARERPDGEGLPAPGGPEWPDPATRPPF